MARRPLLNTLLKWLLKWLPIALALLLVAMWAQPVPAAAHALLVRSIPEANSEAIEPPRTLQLWFSEPLESSFTNARLIDSTGAEVATGKVQIDPADANHLTVPLGQLQPGIYVVTYQTLSTVDGHEWYGSFPFTVLNADGSRPSGIAATVGTGERGEIPPPQEVAARWLALLGMMGIFGLSLFQLLVIPAAVVKGDPSPLASASERLISNLLLGAVTAMLVGSWLQIGIQLMNLGDFAALSERMFGTRTGLFLVARQVCAIVAAGILLLTPNRTTSVLLTLLGAAGLLTFSMTSHAGAVPGSGWAIAGDYLHLLAAATWLGGLVVLPFLSREARRLPAVQRRGMPKLLLRFSDIAGFSVFLLAVTGLFSSFVEISSFADLINSSYGRVLLAKLFLVVVAIEVAFFSRRLVHNQAQSLQQEDGLRAFSRLITLEALIAILLMVAVATLVQTPPPRTIVQSAPVEQPFNTIAQADDLLIHLQVTPNQAGYNRFWTHLYHADGTPVGEVQLVRLLFDYQETQLGQGRVDLEAQGQDTFAAEGAFLSQAGDWNITIYTRRRGLDDTLTPVTVSVLPPVASAEQTPWQNPLPNVPLGVPLGAALLALGLVPFLWQRPLASARASLYPAARWVGTFLLVVGLALAIGSFPSVFTNVLASRPVPASSDSIAAGAALFQTHCASCHGVDGLGDGPASAGLFPPPANMSVHIPLHDDQEIYQFIEDGFPGTAMPAFGEQLEREEIWHLTNYLRATFDGG
jgi:copper transport protein